VLRAILDDHRRTKAFRRLRFDIVRKERTMLLDVVVGLLQIAVEALEQGEVGTHDIGAGFKRYIAAIVGVLRPIRQLEAHIDHIPNHDHASRPLSLPVQMGDAGLQATLDEVFQIVRRVLRLIAEDLHVIRTHRYMIEVVEHPRREDADLIALAGINEDVDLNLGDIAEKAIHILGSDQADLPALNQIHDMRQARAFADLLRAADPGIHVDHQDGIR